MPTQITNKQVKIINTVNFNNQAIENAIIDAVDNTIIGLVADESFNDAIQDINTEIDGITNTLLTKQDVLVSGTNIKTINNNSILGSGNLEITAETNEIITLPTTSTTVTLSSNNIYKLNVDDFGPSPTITINLTTPQNLNIDNSILLYLGGVHLGSTFNWGATHFFNDETPTIENNGCYDVCYIWNPFFQAWVGKVVLSINYDNM